MRQKEYEKWGLIISIVLNFFIALAGFWMFFHTRVQALFLDGFFSFISFASCVSGLIVSKLSSGNTKNFPEGLYFLEPLYAIIKSTVTLILLVISLMGTGIATVKYLLYGIGSPLIQGPIIPYTISMVSLCFFIVFCNRYLNKKMNNTSIILHAEAEASFIDGIQTIGIGLAIILLNFIDINGPLGFLHYTADFFITFFLVVISIKEPVVLLSQSLRELVQGTVGDKTIEKTILEVLKDNLNDIIPEKTYYIYKIGTHIKIQIVIHSVLDTPMIDLLTQKRKIIIDKLNNEYESIELNYLF